MAPSLRCEEGNVSHDLEGIAIVYPFHFEGHDVLLKKKRAVRVVGSKLRVVSRRPAPGLTECADVDTG